MGAMPTIKPRRGTTAEWEAANPILEDKELGFDYSRGAVRIGDGTTRWNDLPDFTGSDTDPLRGGRPWHPFA